MAQRAYVTHAIKGLAHFLREVGLHSWAANCFQFEWNRGARNAPLSMAIGTARLLAGQDSQAVAFFRETFKRDPALTEARGGLVCALFRLGQTREAAREALGFAQAEPCPETWVLLAALRKKSGDTVGSIEAFRNAAAAPASPNSFLLGELILGEREWAELVAPLENIQKSRSAVGVGTHLVRNRSSLVARARAKGKEAALLALLGASMGRTLVAQEARPSPDPSPTPEAPRVGVARVLPSAGSLSARVVQLNAGLVLEREEGAGLFPAEPSRLVFRGGSWTQTRVEVDGFDVTDPIFGGRPLVWSAVDLGDLEVTTDARGTVVSQAGPRWEASSGKHFVAQTSLGVFDSAANTKAPIPSLARGHHLFDGLIGASTSLRGGATVVSGVLSGADVSRSERDSDAERATARLGFEGRLNHAKGNDQFQGLVMYQGARGPFGLTSAETRSSGLLLGTAWTRNRATGGPDGGWDETRVRVSYLRGAATDPEFGAARTFERLVEGPPNLQVPYDASSQRLQLEGAAHLWALGGGIDSSVGARFSRTTDARGIAQPNFVALERLNGFSAREWTFAGAAPSRMVENRASLWLGFGAETSQRTRFTGKVGLQRVTVGDRDGERILGSTKVLPELRFEWNKSETTKLYAEASMGTPPVPLVSYEAAAKNAPAVSARLWRDLNGDGRATAGELGAEVSKRGPGSVAVDPDLSMPTMRRVTVSFASKIRGLHVRATAFARRDVDLIETALDPQGAEILRTRNIPDPSGDILGASDDQILPLVEESPRSFTSSQFKLTNPPRHRALGEGAELTFETHAKHVHWGLLGAAFRNSGRGGNRGLRVGENDFGVVGESFDRTNADTFGYGRLFFDRAYSLKMYLTANDVSGFTFGAVARYDDGQPFARLVIRNDLPQGPDFVQAIPRGRARLHYTLSVDGRLARKFQIAGASLEVSASVFNALGSQFEAEEQVVWLSDYRRITMVQPPRAFIIGLRIEP